MMSMPTYCRTLTADDLIGLGVTSIGHRRTLLAAIAALRAGPSPSRAASAPVERAPDAIPTANPPDAERRQLTVMFVDLVGSTALSARLDPEDLREVIGAYHRCVADGVGRFDGFVAKYMGDGVLAYFGYPQAHEDDAERAVRPAWRSSRRSGGSRRPRPGAAAGPRRHRHRPGGRRRPHRRRRGAGARRRGRDPEPRRAAAGAGRARRRRDRAAARAGSSATSSSVATSAPSR